MSNITCNIKQMVLSKTYKSDSKNNANMDRQVSYLTVLLEKTMQPVLEQNNRMA